MGAIKSYPIKILNSRETTNHRWYKNRKWLSANLSRQVFSDVFLDYRFAMCSVTIPTCACFWIKTMLTGFPFVCKNLNLSKRGRVKV